MGIYGSTGEIMGMYLLIYGQQYDVIDMASDHWGIYPLFMALKIGGLQPDGWPKGPYFQTKPKISWYLRSLMRNQHISWSQIVTSDAEKQYDNIYMTYIGKKE